ncbi:hypothetical protein ACS5PN_03575 [Roseateles sp. NT4]|uniref:hypothetical protein n=1 Tax=Roseateles sp. NT4 TaxID=3453715 RepID=UPI003EEBBA99
MNATTISPGAIPGTRPIAAVDADVEDRGHSHSVCWGAVFAGAAGAASLSLILLILGVGLGLSSVSPWSSDGVSAETFGVSTIAWLTFTQLAASGLGGYLAGRLRHRWAAVHTDEVYFRDTAHGFLAWSVATLVTASMLTAAVGSIVSGGAKAGAAVAGTAVAGAAAAAPAAAAAASAAGVSPDYFVDSLFRRDAASPAAAASVPGTAASAATTATAGNTAMPANQDKGTAPTAEVVRIFANAAASTGLGADDTRYLGQLVSQRTSLSQQDAERRVTDTYARMQAKANAAKEDAKAAADKARKATAAASLWAFISLLIGAFVASFLGTVGGRHRDQF